MHKYYGLVVQYDSVHIRSSFHMHIPCLSSYSQTKFTQCVFFPVLIRACKYYGSVVQYDSCILVVSFSSDFHIYIHITEQVHFKSAF